MGPTSGTTRSRTSGTSSPWSSRTPCSSRRRSRRTSASQGRTRRIARSLRPRSWPAPTTSSRALEGYETQVGERAMKLSGGERQRISLARAFLKNAPILILDEPTSALDLQTEASIIDALHRLVKGRTTLMIAHRPSTLRACDSLLLLEPNGNSRMTREVGSSLLRMASVGVEGSGVGLVDEGAH